MATSDQLSRLRKSASRQATIYRDFRKAVQAIYSAGHPLATRNYLVEREVTKAREALENLIEQRRSDKADIEKRAALPRVQATPEARLKVEKALASPGFAGPIGFNDLCELLVAEGDRAGLAALRDILPYAARDGRLFVPAGINSKDYGSIVKHSQDAIERNEATLHKKTEAEAHAELREVEISWPHIEQNYQRLAKLFNDQMTYAQTGPVQETLSTLTRWQGMPDDNQPKGLMRLDDNATEEDDPSETVQKVAAKTDDYVAYF